MIKQAYDYDSNVSLLFIVKYIKIFGFFSVRICTNMVSWISSITKWVYSYTMVSSGAHSQRSRCRTWCKLSSTYDYRITMESTSRTIDYFHLNLSFVWFSSFKIVENHYKMNVIRNSVALIFILKIMTNVIDWFLWVHWLLVVFSKANKNYGWTDLANFYRKRSQTR